MALCTFTRTTYHSGAGMAADRVDYITRQGPYQSRAAERVQYQGIEAGAASRREDLVYWRARNMPEWSKDNPAHFFASAEKHERVGGVAYTEWRFSLPRELSHSQNMAVARDVLQLSFGETHPHVWAFHDPPAADGEKQPHCHVLFSARTLDGVARTEETFFARWNSKHPERGGAQKDPTFSHMGAIFAARQMYSDIVNLHLQAHGHAARVDARSLEDRGIDREPERKLRPSDSYALKHRYALTDDMREVMQHRHAHEGSRGAEQVQARTAWEARKMTLGIVPGMEMPQALARVRESRDHAVQHKPTRPTVARELSPYERTLAAEITSLERYQKQLTTEIGMERLCAQTGQARALAGRQHGERLLAEGKAYGIAEPVPARTPQRTPARSLTQQLRDLMPQEQREQEPQGGAGLRVRVFEEERDRGQEMDMGR